MWKKVWNFFTFSPQLTQILEYLNQFQILHQTQLLVQHPRMPLSQINLTALQLLAPMVGSRAGSLLLWENASLRVTSMVSIDLTLLFLLVFLGLLLLGLQVSFFSGHLRHSTHHYSQYDTCNHSVICLVNKHHPFPSFLGYIFSPTSPSLHSVILSSLTLPVFYSTQTPRSMFNLTPVILITILIWGFPTLESYSHLSPLIRITNRRLTLTIKWVSDHSYGCTFLMTAPDCIVPARSVYNQIVTT